MSTPLPAGDPSAIAASDLSDPPAPAFTDAEAAGLALRCLDLTSLRDDDDHVSITALAARAATGHGAPAALCVHPVWLATARAALDARGLQAVRLATVVNFPRGDAHADAVVAEVAAALAAGADEIDCVLPWRALQAGDAQAGHDLLNAVRGACGRTTLKVILETGELAEPALIAQASRIALDAGADFIKTSTGKTARHADARAVAVMLGEIVAARRDGRPAAGLKVSGGVAGVADVQAYLALAARALGRDALTPDTLRFGASSLLPALLAVLDGGGVDDAGRTLLEAARSAREHAWAPYSRFRVGAAVRTNDGRVFAGCNVENAAYGLCNCAERTALFSAIAAGVKPRELEALAVVGDTAGPISPCGACRQVIFELGGPDLTVWLGNLGDAMRRTTAGSLLPDGFAFDTGSPGRGISHPT